MKKWVFVGFTGLLFGVLFTGSFGSSFVSATSDYDDVWHSADQLLITNNNFPECEIKLQYNNILVDEFIDSPEFSSYQQAFETGSWMIYNWWNGSQYQLIYLWSENENIEISYDVDPISNKAIASANEIKLTNIRIKNNSCDLEAQYLGSTNSRVVSTNRIISSGEFSGSWYENTFLAANVNMNYPLGYDGELIRDSLGDMREIIRPDFYVDVLDKNIIWNLNEWFDELPGYENEDLAYEFFIADSESNTEFYQVVTEYDELPLDHQFEEYGKYTFSVTFLIGGCHRYPSYPATPDYCWWEKPKNTDDYIYYTIQVELDIDGSTFQYDTDNEDCEIGFCVAPVISCSTLYEDNFLGKLVCSMDESLDFGVINPSISAIRKFIGSFSIKEPNCDITVNNWSYQGKTIEINTLFNNICDKAEELQNKFPIWIIIVNFTGSVILFGMIAGAINRVLNKDDDNLIQPENITDVTKEV